MRDIVISVGTSLLQNLLDQSEKLEQIFGTGSDDTAKIRIRDVLDDNWNISNQSSVHQYFKPYRDYYLSHFARPETIQGNIAQRKRKRLDLLPAEISSLYLYYYDVDGKPRHKQHEDGSRDRVLLLCTETPSSITCGILIKEILRQVELFSSKCELLTGLEKTEEYFFHDGLAVVKNLDIHNSENWLIPIHKGFDPNCGFYNLRELMRQLYSSRNSNSFPPIVVRTGSYKELSANLLILAAEIGFDSFYLFENSITGIITSVESPMANLSERILGLKTC
jgi:CRISPR/Cas system-associated protein Csm6